LPAPQSQPYEAPFARRGSVTHRKYTSPSFEMSMARKDLRLMEGPIVACSLITLNAN